MERLLHLSLALLLLGWAASCGGGYKSYADNDGGAYAAESPGVGVMTQSASARRSGPGAAPSQPRPAPAPSAASSGGAPPPPPADPNANREGQSGEQAAPVSASRKVVYRGFLQLQVKKPIEAADAVAKVVDGAGGYVDSLGPTHVVVRTPVERFDEVMDALAKIGVVLDRRADALDVTAQYTDLKGRLAILEETRTRLMLLLEQTKDVKQRLMILTQIKRLTEQIEALSSTLKTLEGLLAYSTITVELVPAVQVAQAPKHRSPFAWVRQLAAHRVTIKEGMDDLKLVPPSNFVLFDDDDTWRAQAADTSMLRAGTVDNDPVGDGAFWMSAIAYEMKGRGEVQVEEGKAGQMPWAVYRNRTKPYRYFLVGVATPADEDEAFVIEAFFPNDEAWSQHGAAIKRALDSFEVD